MLTFWFPLSVPDVSTIHLLNPFHGDTSVNAFRYIFDVYIRIYSVMERRIGRRLTTVLPVLGTSLFPALHGELSRNACV